MAGGKPVADGSLCLFWRSRMPGWQLSSVAEPTIIGKKILHNLAPSPQRRQAKV